jgi:hypothetical protein
MQVRGTRPCPAPRIRTSSHRFCEEHHHDPTRSGICRTLTLRLVLGDEAAATLTDLPLADVFRFDAGTPALQEGIAHYGPLRTLAAAVELMARALSRTLADRDCLADPASVRKLLQLRLGGSPMRSSRCCCSMRRTA